jgi:hypothetical protein
LKRRSEAAPTVVPVLTEVIDLDAIEEPVPNAPMLDAALAPTEPGKERQHPLPAREFDDEAIARGVMEDLQRQIDLMIEHRVGAALEPILRRLTENVAAEARTALALSLKDTLRLAVKQELDRVRRKAQGPGEV